MDHKLTIVFSGILMKKIYHWKCDPKPPFCIYFRFEWKCATCLVVVESNCVPIKLWVEVTHDKSLGLKLLPCISIEENIKMWPFFNIKSDKFYKTYFLLKTNDMQSLHGVNLLYECFTQIYPWLSPWVGTLFW
jgi:hypothetical protein